MSRERPHSRFLLSIRGTMLILVLVVLLPVLVLQLGVYYTRYETRRQEEFQANLEIARAAAAACEGYLQNLLNEQLAIGLALIHLQPLPPEQASALLVAIAASYPSVRDFSLVSAQGRVVASSRPEVRGLDISDRPYFGQIVQGREWIVGDLSRDELTGEPFLVVARSIRNQQGALQGVITAVVNPQSLGEVLPVRQAAPRVVTLIDRQGSGVYQYPESERTWEQRGRLVTSLVEGSLLAGKESTAIFVSEPDGKARMAGMAPVRSIGWVVLADRPEAEVVAPILNRALRDFGLLLLVGAAALFLSLMVSRMITTPLRGVAQYAVVLGHGDAAEPVEIAGPTELRELADVLNRMAQEVHLREGQLQESEQRFRKVFEEGPLGMAIVNMDYKLVSVNPMLCQMLGYTQQELAPLALPDVACSEDADRDAQAAQRLSRGEIPYYSVEKRWLRKNNEVIWVNLTCTIIHDAQGGPLYFLVMIENITDRKRAEQFRQEYVSLISHDLRNPLTVLMGMTQLLAHNLVQKGLQREVNMAESILKNARRMNSMIQDMVESSRLTSGQLKLRKEPVDLGQLIRDIAERVGTVDDRERIMVEAPVGWRPVLADPERIERAIVNLIANALRYSAADKSVLVKVGYRCDEAMVSVEDQGMGIPSDDLPHLFEQFYRAKTAGSLEGLGLGLYITRLIVEAHGGRAWAESELGRGSTFYFTLPFA